MKRSVGVTVWALLLIVGGGLAVMWPVGFFSVGNPMGKGVRGLLMELIPWLHGLLGLAALVAGIGLLMLKGWARVLTICQAALSIVVGLVSQMMMQGW